MTTDPAWEQRIAALWAAIDDLDPADFRARVEALTAELPEGDGISVFEVACANDSTGRPEQAAPRYREALADTGREREAAGLAIGALARHLPRYHRSMARYAAELSGR